MLFLRNFKLLLIAFLGISLALAAQPDELLKPGATAPACELEATDGQRYQFPVAGSWNMVFYWSLFCHSCLDEIPAVQQRLASDSLAVKPFFIALDSKRMEKALKNFSAKRNLTLPIMYEEIASETYFTADKWGVLMTPSVFIVDPQGKVTYSHAGPMDIDKFFADFAEMQKAEPAKESCCDH